MPEVGSAWYEIDARTNRLRARLDESDRRVEQTGARAERSLGGRLTGALGTFGGVIGGIAKLAAGTGLLLGGAFAVIGGLAVKGAADAESMQASWETLLGSVEKANARVAELKEFAATTPFEIPEVMAASRTLQVFGGDALATGDNLRLVGDIASGVQQPFSDVAMWIGRTYDAMESGQPFGEAAMRLQEMGALSGEGRRRLEELAKAAKDGGMTMDEAWTEAQKIFGQFAGQMERQSQTLNGQISNLMDNIGQTLAGVGEILLPVVKEIVQGLNRALPTIKQVFIDVFTAAEPILRGVGDAISMLISLIAGFLDEGTRMEDEFADQGAFGLLASAIAFVVETAQRMIPILVSAFESALAIGQAVFPVLADIATIAVQAIGMIVEEVAPVIERAFAFLATEVIPPLQRAFAAIHEWIVANWPAISKVIAAAAGAIGTALSVIISVLEVLWPIIVRVGEVVLPILGAALSALLPILETLFTVFDRVFGDIGTVVTFVIENVVRPVVEAVIGWFEGTFVPAIEFVGEVWGAVWGAVGSFFRDLWNGILRFFGGIVGTIIGIVKNLMGVAASIPGPWQDGAKAAQAALAGMEADVRSWGTDTSGTLTRSYAEHRRLSKEGAANTAKAYGDAFAAQASYIAGMVAKGLEPARGLVYATSPPPDPRSPFHKIDEFAASTAEAYGDAFAARGQYIAAAVQNALGGARELLTPNLNGTIGTSRTLEAHIVFEVRDPTGALAHVPGGAAGVAHELQRGFDATGLLLQLRHQMEVR
jgi:hypothetical protein